MFLWNHHKKQIQEFWGDKIEIREWKSNQFLYTDSDEWGFFKNILHQITTTSVQKTIEISKFLQTIRWQKNTPISRDSCFNQRRVLLCTTDITWAIAIEETK